MTFGKMLFLTFVVTVVLEVITCIGRFGLRVSMQEHAASMKKLTFGIRIHHGYVGIVLLLVYAVDYMINLIDPDIVPWVFVLGGSLLLSDLIHHFIVLKLIVGRTEFP